MSMALLKSITMHTTAFVKIYSSTSANNNILAGVQHIFIQKILPQHRPLSN